MSIFATLAREHRLFRRLIDKLERSLQYQEELARKELRDAILVLLPALDRHEEIEHLLFDHPEYSGHKEAKKLLGIVDAQHRKIKALRKDLRAFIGECDAYSLARLRALGFLFIGRLRLHFETEETMLWPHYNSPGSRSIRRSIELKTRRKVRVLEAEVKSYWTQVEDYIGGRWPAGELK